MDTEPPGPRLRQVVLDTEDARGLAEFYRQLLGLTYRAGDEPPPAGQPDDADWLVLRDGAGMALAFQQVEHAPRSTWPEPGQAQMLHLDMTVDTVEELFRQRDRAVSLGAEQLLDRSDDAEEPLFVLADLAGHPFCVFVA
jgi:catechol-2,3-dioxygenase